MQGIKIKQVNFWMKLDIDFFLITNSHLFDVFYTVVCLIKPLRGRESSLTHIEVCLINALKKREK